MYLDFRKTFTRIDRDERNAVFEISETDSFSRAGLRHSFQLLSSTQTTMGGNLWIEKIKPADNDDSDDEGPTDFWCYRYSYFHIIKGTILRGGIGYLRSLSDCDLTEDFLVKEGLVAGSSTSEAAVITNARVRINAATQLLESWKREISTALAVYSALGRGLPPSTGSSVEPTSSWKTGGLVHAMALDNAVTSNTARMRSISLARLNLEGIYLMLSMHDNSQKLSYQDAQKLAFALGKVEKFCDWEGQLYDEEKGLTCSQSLKEFLERCGVDEKIRG